MFNDLSLSDKIFIKLIATTKVQNININSDTQKTAQKAVIQCSMTVCTDVIF